MIVEVAASSVRTYCLRVVMDAMTDYALPFPKNAEDGRIAAEWSLIAKSVGSF
jgi:hypothetical protein